MGLIIMTVSMLLGIILIGLGVSRKENKRLRILFFALGIVLALIGVYLGLPK